MRRVLFLITDLELGGTPIVVRELATRLRSASLEIEVACLKPMGIVGEQLRAAGLRVTSFDARGVLDLRRTIRSLATLVNDRKIDTVFSFLIHANFVASRAARLLPGVRFLQSIQTTQPRPRWHWWLQRRVQSAAELIIVPSESIAKRAKEWCDVPGEKIRIIPNAVDSEHFRSMSVPLISEQNDRNGHASFRVGFVGRLDPIKRVGDLIAAVAMLEESAFSLDIWGSGPDHAALVRYITLEGLDICSTRFDFHGQIVDVRKAYAAIDVLVLPSDAEGFGLVLIEAMAAGVPVIGTNVDGIRDVIRDGETGLLVPPRDPPALAAAITRISEDGALRQRLVANALVDVQQRFAWPAVLEQYRSLLL